MSACIRITVKDPALTDYRAPAPGKMLNRWGCYRRGYPVWCGDDVGVYLGLVPIPRGPAGADARDYARAYGRDCYVAIKVNGVWERIEVSAGDISPPTGTERINGRIPLPGPIVVRP
jgi:hypothetical protein